MSGMFIFETQCSRIAPRAV